MKYGRIVFTREFVSPTVCNIGDIVQTFAIDLIYEKMNIPKEDIIDIQMETIGNYKGEKVILPINGYFLYSKEYPAFPTSEDIVPIFLGVYNTSSQYLKHSDFWKKSEPIGCRDEATMLAMRKRGYNAYLTGCTTILTEKREEKSTQNKVFIVDVHPSINKYIPEKLKNEAVYVSHDIPISKNLSKEDSIKYMQEKTKEIYDTYRDEAKLIITSRLHCAAPCIAMGIPVIVAKNGFDERFGWLDRYIHLYTPDEYEHIDWNPKSIDIEELKSKLMEYSISAIMNNPNLALAENIHDYYMSREKKDLSTPLFVKGYTIMAQYFPKTANFIKDTLLKKFTIAGNKK